MQLIYLNERGKSIKIKQKVRSWGMLLLVASFILSKKIKAKPVAYSDGIRVRGYVHIKKIEHTRKFPGKTTLWLK